MLINIIVHLEYPRSRWWA